MHFKGERVAVERELGSGQGDIMTRIPKVIILGHLALVLMLPLLSGIGCCIDTRQFPSIPRTVVLIFIPKHQVVVY